MSSKAAMPEHCHYASMRDSRQQGLAAAPSRQVKVRRMRSPCNPPPVPPGAGEGRGDGHGPDGEGGLLIIVLWSSAQGLGQGCG